MLPCELVTNVYDNFQEVHTRAIQCSREYNKLLERISIATFQLFIHATKITNSGHNNISVLKVYKHVHAKNI